MRLKSKGDGLVKYQLGTKQISELLISHTAYLSSLSVWNQFIVWRYTLGSGSVNSTLIGLKNTPGKKFWVRDFFSAYNLKVYGKDNIHLAYRKYLKYFENPKLVTDDIVNDVIELYIVNLTKIIDDSPPVPNDITVFKASSVYDPVLESKITKPVPIKQAPFNSTTYDPEFEFNIFLTPEASCCMWKITIPKGSKVLSVNPVFHAYAFEREIILPPNSVFTLVKSEETKLKYVDKDKFEYEQLQDPPFVIGEVFRQMPYYYPKIKEKNIRLLSANFSN